MADQLAGQAAVVQIDTEQSPALAARFGVRGIPVLKLLRQGKEVAQLPGAQTAAAVAAWFRQQRGR